MHELFALAVPHAALGALRITATLGQERSAWALFSVTGATYSPISRPTNISTSMGFITAQTIRPMDTPAARMMVNSLLLARLPRPIRHPISAAIGNISYNRRGAVSRTKLPASITV